MVEVRFYDTVNDELLKFAVIISRRKRKYDISILCKELFFVPKSYPTPSKKSLQSP